VQFHSPVTLGDAPEGAEVSMLAPAIVRKIKDMMASGGGATRMASETMSPEVPGGDICAGSLARQRGKLGCQLAAG
jgi:hypothetical protein